MKSPLLYFVLCLLLAGTGQLRAQSEHVYEDSSILYPKEEESVKVEEVPAEPEEEKVYTTPSSDDYHDTILVNNRLFLSPDSVEYFRRDKHFAYARNLDSLLEALRKKNEQDAAEREARQKRKRSYDSDTSADEQRQFSQSPSVLEKFFTSNGLQIALWCLAGLFVLFVIYKLFFGAGSFRATSAKQNVAIADEAEEEKPLQEKEYDAAVRKAIAENNYRMAVRYLHLQLLRRLSDAGAIVMTRDKTNAEYLREITGKPYKSEVSELTRYYDYVWYGGFVPGHAAFDMIQSRFKNVVI